MAYRHPKLNRIFAAALFTLNFAAAPTSAFDLFADQNDLEHSENGSVLNEDATELRIGVGPEPVGNGRNAILNFQLPDLDAIDSPFTSAVLTVNVAGIANVDGFSFNVDLYALPPRPGFATPVLGTVYYYESDMIDTTAGVTLIQTDFIAGGSGVALGAHQTNAAGSAALLAYLNAQYDGGNGAGEYVFFRLNPDADNQAIVEGYNIASANNTNTEIRPKIDYSTVVVQVRSDSWEGVKALYSD